MNRTLARVVLVVGGGLLGLLAAESALRLAYPTLPSISAIRDRDWGVEKTTWQAGPEGGSAAPHTDGCLGDDAVDLAQRSQRFGADGAGEPVTLWIAGDSFTEGSGDERGGGYAPRLGRALAERLERPVTYTRFGHSGGNYCTWTAELRWALSQGLAPDLLVVQLFADDLEQHTMLAVGGKLVRFPHTEPDDRVRWAVRRSYLANLLWFSWGIRSGATSRRLIHQRSQADFVRTLRELDQALTDAGAGLLVFQVDPTGPDLCPADPVPGSRCAHLVEDGALIAGLARDAGVPYVDLRDLWAPDGGDAWALEVQAFDAGEIDMVVHPGPDGHARLAETLLPRVAPLLE